MRFFLALLLSIAIAQASIFSDGIKAYQNKDYEQAFQLFKRALNNQSSIQANYFLGLMYLRGWGTQKNLSMAQRHLSLASAIGNARAKCLLAETYLQQDQKQKARSILSDKALQNVFECGEVKEKYKLQ